MCEIPGCASERGGPAAWQLTLTYELLEVNEDLVVRASETLGKKYTPTAHGVHSSHYGFSANTADTRSPRPSPVRRRRRRCHMMLYRIYLRMQGVESTQT